MRTEPPGRRHGHRTVDAERAGFIRRTYAHLAGAIVAFTAIETLVLTQLSQETQLNIVRTMLGGLRPRRFWSSLKPSQPSRPRRVVLYWLIATLLLPVGYAGAVGSSHPAMASRAAG